MHSLYLYSLSSKCTDFHSLPSNCTLSAGQGWAECNEEIIDRLITYQNNSFQLMTVGVNVLPGDIWQPLSSKTGPLQRVSHNQIIKKRSVFLPYFIFFIYHPLLHRVIEGSCNRKGRENQIRSVKMPSI